MIAAYCRKVWIHRANWLLAAALLLAWAHGACASTLASITVAGNEQGSDAASITVAFNAFTETIHYDATSTPASVASAFAAMFSRDFLSAGLCASASGNVISLKLKSGSFGPVTIAGSSASFQLSPSGFGAAGASAPTANAGGLYTGTINMPLNFSGAASSDPQGQPLTYTWSFGDGGTATGVTPVHTYTAFGNFTVTLTVADTSGLTGTVTTTASIPNGIVSNGTQPGGMPIIGAHVYLFAAGTNGYSQASVPLLNASSTGLSDAVGAYVLTGANGGFVWAGDYSCAPGAQVYAYALGGNIGAGNNPASGLLAILGSCPASGNFSSLPTLTINEVTTVAAAYAFAGFAVDATHVSSSGTPLAQIGVANAFANAGNLVNLATGTALATTPAGNGTVPQAEINTLANILASCVSAASGCNSLLATATSDGTAAGAVPEDTATVAIDIAHHPGLNVAALASASSSAQVFLPAYTFLPTTLLPSDWSVLLTFSGGGLYQPQERIAVDATGNVWAFNFFTMTELSSLGAALSPSTGFNLGLTQSFAIGPAGATAVDPAGDVWTMTGAGVCELSHSGSLLSPVGGYSAGSAPILGGMAIDGLGDVWLTDERLRAVTELANSGGVRGTYNPGTPTGGPFNIGLDGTGRVLTEDSNGLVVLSGDGAVISSTAVNFGTLAALAVDNAGAAWIATGGPNLWKVSVTGTASVASYNVSSDGRLLELAIDGAGNVWLANVVASPIGFITGIVEFSNSGTVLSPAGGLTRPFYTDGYATTGFPIGQKDVPAGIAVDSSGDIWVTNKLENSLSEIIGIATPVVTPLSVGVRDGTLGTRP